MDTKLAKDMVARADQDGLPAGHPLRDLAAKFDEAANGFYAAERTVTAQQFMGHWARARRAWSEYTGTPLL